MKQSREHVIERVKRRLLHRGSPRRQMFLILSVTGAVGFFISYALLHVGLTWMWLRYPICILLAYCVFLLILRLWLFSHSREQGPRLDSDPSVLDAVDSSALDLLPGEIGSGGSGGISVFGGGGDFGGGGAGGSWGEAVSSAQVASPGSGGGSGGGSSGGGGGGSFDFDLEEGWLIVLAVAVIFAALFASLYIVYIAPELLAEILVDGLLVGGLYKRLKGLEQRNWLGTAVRKTLLPALIVALLFSVAGYLLQRAVPRANSIGDVWTSRTSAKR
jgi:hypothetical protein